MTASTVAMLSGLLAFGAPLALAVVEIVSLGRGRRGGGDDRDPPPAPAPKPLPDCLQPHVLLARPPMRQSQDA